MKKTFFNGLSAVQGYAAIFDGCKPLKMKAAGNRIFRFLGRKSPWKDFFNILPGAALDIERETIAGMISPAYTLLTGNAARQWLEDSHNQMAWERLAADCPWTLSTLVPGYYRLWLTHYASQWEPIIAIQDDAQGGLQAIMPLARSGNTITGAGAHQAEYQGWLSRDENIADFLRSTLSELRARFPTASLRLQYLVPRIPTASLQLLAKKDARIFLEPKPRPMMRTNPEAILAKLNKKSTRSKRNRLRRSGELMLRHITNPRDFEGILDWVVPQYDLRQGALNDSCPFQDDPVKRSFLLDWAEQTLPEGALITCLSLDRRPLAVFIGAIERDECQLAIIAHDPRFNRYSPGKLLLYDTAMLLAEQGVSYLDLTPGGDPWKERFTDGHDEVSSLLALPDHSSAIRLRTRRHLEKALRRILLKAGLTPASVRRWLRPPAPNTGKAYSICHHIELSGIDCTDITPAFHRDRIADLFHHPLARERTVRQAFLRDALGRIEDGSRLYTRSTGDDLVGLAWATITGKEAVLNIMPTKAGRTASHTFTHGILCDLRQQGISMLRLEGDPGHCPPLGDLLRPRK